ncbi:hypothetical protein LMG26857_03371 [Achromobacter anxifer]|uniref:hypothetical protein n=1 Tax=Achromobacter anxifer TaxID=1287737 RepID=UPI00155B57B2|nr:hypothetical protein [Achromobacter anxifer]CAB5514312.1 hypothetical protein LMG26857_03371 [Achromobacter anxifer]
MGQAKQRGTREERVALARAAQEREEPINVPCKTCKAVLNGFKLFKHTAAGAAWQKTCKCGAVTTALVQPTNGNLVRTFRQSLSLQEAIVDRDRRTSVSFLEKNLDTVETGIIRL